MGRVLIVDEEPMLRLLLRLVLENEGHDVRDADDGRDALILVGSWRPHVVVTDLALPGLGGSDLVKRMRMRTESLDMRIVATTTGTPTDVDVDAVFIKPYDAQLLAKEIDSMLGVHSEDVGPPPRRSLDGELRARSALLSDIWSRLVSVDTRSRLCDPECDAALEEILRLAKWVDERTGAIEESATRPASDPDGLAPEVLGL